MRIRNDRLIGPDGKTVPFDDTPNKSRGEITPEYLVMHYTASGTLRGTVGWFNNPDANASAHLVIGHDGSVIQMGRFNQRLWHAGRSRLGGRTNFNAFSIGIEIVNWGKLSRMSRGWASWTGAAVPQERVAVATHKLDSRESGWEVFDAAQLDAALAASRAICTHYGISQSKVVGHDDISGYRGKRDPGPVFELERFKDRLFGRPDGNGSGNGWFQVVSVNGLNLREGPGVGFPVLEALPNGTRVIPIQTDGVWWLVAKADADGNPDKTGWVHSNWLAEV